ATIPQKAGRIRRPAFCSFKGQKEKNNRMAFSHPSLPIATVPPAHPLGFERVKLTLPVGDLAEAFLLGRQDRTEQGFEQVRSEFKQFANRTAGTLGFIEANGGN